MSTMGTLTGIRTTLISSDQTENLKGLYVPYAMLYTKEEDLQYIICKYGVTRFFVYCDKDPLDFEFHNKSWILSDGNVNMYQVNKLTFMGTLLVSFTQDTSLTYNDLIDQPLTDQNVDLDINDHIRIEDFLNEFLIEEEYQESEENNENEILQFVIEKYPWIKDICKDEILERKIIEWFLNHSDVKISKDTVTALSIILKEDKHEERKHKRRKSNNDANERLALKRLNDVLYGINDAIILDERMQLNAKEYADIAKELGITEEEVIRQELQLIDQLYPALKGVPNTTSILSKMRYERQKLLFVLNTR